MKRIACLLLGVALAGSGCLGVQKLDPPPLPPPAPVVPPPPPVLAGQATEANAQQVLQALNAELDWAAAEKPAAPAPVSSPIGVAGSR
jgi:hypothetical protein